MPGPLSPRTGRAGRAYMVEGLQPHLRGQTVLPLAQEATRMTSENRLMEEKLMLKADMTGM